MPRRDVVTRCCKAQIAQYLERREQCREWRPAGGDLLEVALVERVRRLLDEPRDKLVVVLGNGPICVARIVRTRCKAEAPESLFEVGCEFERRLG